MTRWKSDRPPDRFSLLAGWQYGRAEFQRRRLGGRAHFSWPKLGKNFPGVVKRNRITIIMMIIIIVIIKLIKKEWNRYKVYQFLGNVQNALDFKSFFLLLEFLYYCRAGRQRPFSVTHLFDEVHIAKAPAKLKMSELLWLSKTMIVARRSSGSTRSTHFTTQFVVVVIIVVVFCTFHLLPDSAFIYF